jgi:hypothetical protein
MMDEEDSQVPIWSYRVNLDKRVRVDHPLRRIRAALDLSFVRKEVAHTYGRRGNKSVPPEVIVRMMRRDPYFPVTRLQIRDGDRVEDYET